MNGRESVLKKALAPLRTEFDYIIIDCPPSLGLITTNALNASDSVLIPVQCEYYALEGLSQLMSSVQAVKRRYNDRLELEGVLLTMYDGRLNLTQQVVTEIKKYFPRKVFATVIPRTVRLSEAPSYGQPILYYDKSNKGCIAYGALADEIFEEKTADFGGKTGSMRTNSSFSGELLRHIRKGLAQRRGVQSGGRDRLPGDFVLPGLDGL